MLVQGINGSHRRSKLNYTPSHSEILSGHQLSAMCIGGPTREYYVTLLLCCHRQGHKGLSTFNASTGLHLHKGRNQSSSCLLAVPMAVIFTAVLLQYSESHTIKVQ